MSLVAAGILAGGALLGGYMSNRANAKTAANQMAFSDEQAQRQMEFQENLANTSHQREVNDLHLAGLNPILSGTGGMGAATPHGAQGASAGFQAVDAVGNATNSAASGARLDAEIKNLKETNTNIRADTDLKASQRALNSINYNKEVHNVDRARWEKEAAESQASIVEATAKGAKTEGEIDDTKYGSFMRYLNRMNPFGSMGSGAIRNLSK